MRLERTLLATCLMVGLSAAGAWAQTIPPSVSPGQIEKSIGQTPPEQPGSGIAVPAPSPAVAPANATQIQLTPTAFDIEGATAVPPDEIAETYSGLIGRKVTMADIYAAANAITALYGKHGYALSFAIVPAQTLGETAKVRIEVVEGYIDEITFTGDAASIPAVVRAYAERIKQSRPLRTADIERFLRLINDIPGVKATGVFERSAQHARGATGLAIHIDFSPVTGSASLDNRGSRAVGPFETDDNVSLNSLLGQGDALRLRLLQTLEWQDLHYGSVGWSLPVGDDGAVVSLSGDYFRSAPGTASLRSLDYTSEGGTERVDLADPLQRGRDLSLWLHGGLVAKQLSSALAQVPDSRDQLFEADFGPTWLLNDATGASSIRTDLVQGLPWFDSTTSDSSLRSRPSGSGQFTLVTANVTRLQDLGGGWQLYGAGMGQLASRGLLAGDQCGYGGPVFGRAFDSSEITGDDCLEASVELRYRPAEGPFSRVQFYVFGDAGATWLSSTVRSGETGTSTGQSAGLGARIDVTENVLGTLEFVQPFSREVALDGNRDPRVFFSLTKGF